MFITTNQQLGFIHIPKCGGTSIFAAFRGGHPKGPNLKNEQDPWSPWPILKTHSSFKEFQKQKKKTDPAIWFTVVRHPCQRYHTWYYFQLARDKKKLNGELPFKGLSKKQIVDRITTFEKYGLKGTFKYLDSIQNIESVKVSRACNWLMYDWIDGCNNIEIFKLEEIEKLYSWLNGIGCTVPYSHVKQTPRTTSWQDDFDDELTELVYQRYKRDFLEFDYKL